MTYTKIAATAFLAVAATGVTAGTTYAAPSEPASAVQDQTAQPTPSVQGTDRGVDYAVEWGVIGLFVAGGPSLLNAGTAYFSGQP